MPEQRLIQSWMAAVRQGVSVMRMPKEGDTSLQAPMERDTHSPGLWIQVWKRFRLLLIAVRARVFERFMQNRPGAAAVPGLTVTGVVQQAVQSDELGARLSIR